MLYPILMVREIEGRRARMERIVNNHRPGVLGAPGELARK